MNVFQSIGITIMLTMIFISTFSNWAEKQGWKRANPYVVLVSFMVGTLFFAIGMVTYMEVQ